MTAASRDAVVACLGEAKPVRRELQRLAKLLGIKANAKSEVIVEGLREWLDASSPEISMEEEVEVVAEEENKEPAAAVSSSSSSSSSSPEAAAAAAAVEEEELPPRTAEKTQRRSSARHSLSLADLLETQEKVAAAVEVVGHTLDRRQSTLADRQARSATKAMAHNRQRSISVMGAFANKVNAKHREGAQKVERPHKKGTHTTSEQPAAVSFADAPVAAEEQEPPAAALVEEKKVLADLNNLPTPTKPPGSQRKAPKSLRSPSNAREERRKTMKSAQRAARSELVASARK